MSERIFANIRRGIKLLVSKCHLLLVDDSPQVQEAQAGLYAGETRDKVERFQEYGFTSVPFPACEGVMVFPGGDRSHGVIIATEDRRYRIKGLAAGEVAIYTDENASEDGCRIVLKRGNRVEIQAADIDLRAENRLHLSGRYVEIHADERREMDVAGYGEALNFKGGNIWQTDTYTLGATVLPSVEHGIQPLEIGGFHEQRAALLADSTTTDKDRLLLCLPAIAEAESADTSDPDATGWALLSGFLHKWFCAVASTDKSLQSPAFVEWDWLLQYSRVDTAWDNLTNPLQLFTVAAKSVLAGYLDDDGYLSGDGGAFDYTVMDYTAMHDRQFQYLAVDEYPAIDGLTASIGAYTLYALAKGTTAPKSDGWEITVTGVSFYLRDGFDFEGDQSLGYFDCEELECEWFLTAVYPNVTNADFRDFRTRHGLGGDFFVYALPRAVDDFEEYVYEI